MSENDELDIEATPEELEIGEPQDVEELDIKIGTPIPVEEEGAELDIVELEMNYVEVGADNLTDAKLTIAQDLPTGTVNLKLEDVYKEGRIFKKTIFMFSYQTPKPIFPPE